MARLLSVSLLFLHLLCIRVVNAQQFIHPGIDLTSADLEYMRTQVLKGEQPWKDAFERLKSQTGLDFQPVPFTHVIRGGYAKPNIGGGELSQSANTAYNCALIWYVTKDKAYARKAIEILDAWSLTLWDFDYNDAKLLAGWTGHILCNAAEILRYTDSGWQQKNTDNFTRLMMTVYYPLLRQYFTQANGNWDGAIIHALMAIGIFTDSRVIFDNAVSHYLRAPYNGSLFKYIYPSGQCQETMRDQGHVQLGLGEFAGAARVAWSQGVDLFPAGNNRLALGYEYTAGFLVGKKPHSYGTISERAREIRDDYEYVYRHYTAMGLQMPNTKITADSIRPKTTRSLLTAFRAPGSIRKTFSGQPRPSPIAFPAGAQATPTRKLPADAIFVLPGQSIQEALDKAKGTGRWVVAMPGVHTLPAQLRVHSGVTLAGEGLSSILFLDPNAGIRDAVVNDVPDLHDFTMRDLVVEGAMRTEPPSDPNSARSYRNPGNRGGVILHGLKEGQMKNISFINVTVRNCTFNGVFITGATGVNIIGCNFEENGSSVVPGPKLQHNLLITHSSDIVVKDSRLDTSPFGSGVALSACRDVAVSDNEIARNNHNGILIQESRNVRISGNLIEANDASGILAEFLHDGSESITIEKNTIQYNDGHPIESYAVKNIKTQNNTLTGNSPNTENLSPTKTLLTNTTN